MKVIYRLCLTLVVATTLTACQSRQQAPVAESLTGDLAAFNWLQQADSVKDSKAAIAKQDHRLWAVNLRGVALPGIIKEKLEQAKQQCKYRFMPGMGDVLKSKQHRQWWKKGKAYAEAYNKIMIEHCLHK
jgi:hypothetical protein